MTAATAMPEAARPRSAERQTLSLSGVSWDEYLRFLELFGEHPGYRLAFDEGELEVMSPSLAHDDDSRFLGDLVRIATMVLKLPSRRGGSTTLRRELAQKGIEPDDCF